MTPPPPPPPNSGVTTGAGVSAVGLTIADVDARIIALVASEVAESNIPVGASPFLYQNVTQRPCTVLISGGTVTTISFSRDGVTFYLVGVLAGSFHLSPGDFLRVVYILAPTMTLVPF